MSHATGLLVPLAHHFQEGIEEMAGKRLMADMPLQTQVVSETLRAAKGKPVVIGDKSLGGLVTAAALVEHLNKNKFESSLPTLLMLGVPLNDFFRPHLEMYLTQLATMKCRVVAFQGTKDKYSKPEGVKAFFEQVGLNPDNVIELPGDHDLGFGEGISDADLQQTGMRLAEVMQKHVFGTH